MSNDDLYETIVVADIDADGEDDSGGVGGGGGSRVVSTLEIRKSRGEADKKKRPASSRQEALADYPPMADAGKPCYKCATRFPTQEELDLHLQNSHYQLVKQEPEATPTPCGKEHIWKPLYIIHAGQGKTPPPDYEEFSCDRCDILFPSQTDLDEHIKVEHPFNPSRLMCEACGRSYSRKYELEVHVKQVHLGIRDFACPHCDYSSADKSRVTKHVKSKHMHEGAKFPCDREGCKFVGSKRGALDIHVKAVHLKIRDFECNECDYKAAQAGQLKKHVQAKHLGLKPHYCNQCSYRATDAALIRRHIRMKHEKIRDFLCTHCGYASSTRRQLEEHIRKRHVEKKRRKTKPLYVANCRLKTT